MSVPRRLAALLAAASSLAFLALPAADAATRPPALPQVAAAAAGARWLAAQVTKAGYVPGSHGGSASLSFTANTILALSAAGVDTPTAESALAYLEKNVDAYVVDSADGGVDGPGQLALAILDAVSLGADPHHFGGTDLVSRLLATQQTAGPDAGLFGTETQVENYAAGDYAQGVALAALAAAGVEHTSQTDAAVGWLEAQQCPDGGWTLPDSADNPCDGSPADYEGPDTNSTSVAVQGLAAQGDLTAAGKADALAFFSAGQDADGGWSYYPNSSASPQSTDPDSTAYVIQGLAALGQSASAARFDKGTKDPVSALLSFRLASGAFYFPPSSAYTENVLATYEAVPALLNLAFPWGPTGEGYWAVSSKGAVYSLGDAHNYGSAVRHGGGSVVAVAATPDGRGYWLATSAGGVYALGDAHNYGSVLKARKRISGHVVSIAATVDGLGYWLATSTGAVYAFGDAHDYGRTRWAVTSIARNPNGGGYWLAGPTGGVYTFGNASFHGSLAHKRISGHVVSIAATPDGRGYWLATTTGAVYALGDAHNYGSPRKPATAIAATPDGRGYWVVGSKGKVYAYGDAGHYGGLPAHVSKPFVALAVNPGHAPA